MFATPAQLQTAKATMASAEEFIQSVATTLTELFPDDPDLGALVDESKAHTDALRKSRFSF